MEEKTGIISKKPGSLSFIYDTYANIEFACRIWGLRCKI